MPQCKAKARSGERCKRAATPGREVCNLHGGKSLRGVASPTFIHGRHSKFLPTRLMDQYQASLSDPELLALDAEIALLDARLADVLARVDSGGAGAMWTALKARESSFQDAQRRNDQDAARDLLADILALIRRGQAEYMAWQEIADLIERRRRVVESEQRRRVAMHQLVQADQMLRIMDVLGWTVRDAVREHVADPAAQRAILVAVQDGLDRILSAPGAGSPSD